MNKFTFYTLIFLLLNVGYSFAANDIPNGMKNYQQNCLVCHGDKGHGNGVVANSLPKRPANIARKLGKPLAFNYLLVNDVLGGKIEKGMPAFNNLLSRQDVYDIFSYVKSIQ